MIAVLLALSYVPTPVEAGSMLKEISNAVALGAGDGADDDLVSFSLHVGAEARVVITGHDYDSFKLYQTGQ